MNVPYSFIIFIFVVGFGYGWLFAKSTAQYDVDKIVWNNGTCKESGKPWILTGQFYGFSEYTDGQGNEFCPGDAFNMTISKGIFDL